MFSHYTDEWLGPELTQKRLKYERILLKIHRHGEKAMFAQGQLTKLKNETIYQAYDRHHKEHLRIVSKYDRYEKMLDIAYGNMINKKYRR